VPIGRRPEIVAAFRAELERLAADPDAVVRAGAAARARVEAHFTWERKAEQVARIYRWVLRAKRAAGVDCTAAEPAPRLAL
jgi:glycosyltransferase involved in cell wall biosynthesis